MRDLSSSIIIRQATAADRQTTIAVVNAAFAIETFLEGTRTDEDCMAAMMDEGEFLPAEDQGNVVACVYIEQRGVRGYFGMLAVDPERQGEGLGRRMIAAAEDHLRRAGCSHIDISVLNLRTDLPALYAKLGYVATGTEEFRLSRPLKAGVQCHAIVMSKTL
jgi:ribosomal protein S18 acetylase RimI-like enzyme